MNKKVVTIFFLLLFTNYLFSNYNIDTIPNKINPSQLVVSNEIDLTPLFEAIKLLEAEKIEEGIIVLNTFYSSLLVQQNYSRIQGYYSLEFYNIIKLSIDENTKRKDKKLIEDFIYQSFISYNYEVLDDINSRLKKNPNDEIPNRLLLYIDLVEGKTQNYIKIAERIQTITPNLFSINSLLADIYLEDSLLEKSLKLYDKCLRIDSSSAYTFYKKSFIYKLQNDTVNQEKNLQKSLELYSQNDLALTEYGILLFNKKEFEKAILHFKSAIDLVRDNYSPAYYYLSIIYFYKKDYSLSLEYCEKVLEYYPDEISTLLTRGKIFSLLGLNEKAFIDFKKVIKLDENNLNAYMLNSYICFEMNKLDEALFYSKKALKLDPGNAMLNKAIASSYYLNMELDSAKKYFRNSYYLETELDEKIEKLNMYLYCETKEIQISKEVKNFEAGIECKGQYCFEHDLVEKKLDYKLRLKLMEVLKDHPLKDANSNLNLYIGNFYKNTENEIALEYYLKASKIDTLNYFAFYGVGEVERKLDNYINSKKYYQKTLKLNPHHVSSLGNLGWVCYLLKEYDECIFYSEKTIQLDENAFYAKFNIALAYLMKGDFERAKKLYVLYKKEALLKNKSLLTARIDLKAALKEGVYLKEIKKILNEVFLDYNYERNMTIDY